MIRYEAETNIYWDAQQFYNTYRVTHNLRVQYNKEEKTCYILEAKPSNAKINISTQTYITIVGIGSSIDNVSYGIKFSCST